nr:MAG TPA: hypothetical protein [Caudoviricetes sp.]
MNYWKTLKLFWLKRRDEISSYGIAMKIEKTK